MEWFEPLESSLALMVAIAKFALESLSVACVIIGLIKTVQLALTLNRRPSLHLSVFPFNQVRLRFGGWLALALEFQLGADIVTTTVAPDLDSLAKLALIAIIRTFLNYFLSKELEAQLSLEKGQAALREGLSEK